MNYTIYLRFSLKCLLIVCCFLLVGCGVAAPEIQVNSLNNPQINGTSIYTVKENITSPTTVVITSTPTVLFTTQETAIPTLGIIAEKTQHPPLAATKTATATPTYIPEPPITMVIIECENDEALPAQVSPVEIDMRGGRISVDGDHLYLAVQQHIGVFDISISEIPEFLGFWEFPDLSDISDIEAKDGIIYVSSGSTLQMFNASPQCRFETIARNDLSIQVYQLELEGERLYAGGVSENDGMRQVIILSLDKSHYQESGIVELGEKSATWSVSEETLYSLSGGDQLFITDVSNPKSPLSQTVKLNIDPEAVLFSPRKFVVDTLYLLLQEHGGNRLTIVSDLKEETPTIIQDPLGYGFGTSDVFRVQDSYIFIGNNGCDVSCASAVTIADVNSSQRLSRFGLQPHHPVYHYQEIRNDLIYALSNDSLLVIDVSNVVDPEIITQIPFMP